MGAHMCVLRIKEVSTLPLVGFGNVVFDDSDVNTESMLPLASQICRVRGLGQRGVNLSHSRPFNG